MPRAPEPGDECRPGGSCPVCNPPPTLCAWCGEAETEDRETPCESCARDLAERAAEEED